jgi:cobalt-precorrin 5A hydrolase
MIVAGIGANSSASVEDVVQGLEQVMSGAPQRPQMIATLADATFTTNVRSAAQRLGLTFRDLAKDALQMRAMDCVTRSERSLTAQGVPSVAEACALAGAGAGSTLIAARLTFGPVTIALARSSP